MGWLIGGALVLAGQVFLGSMMGRFIRLGRKGLNHGH